MTTEIAQGELLLSCETFDQHLVCPHCKYMCIHRTGEPQKYEEPHKQGGIGIRYECESCHNSMILSIGDHKGRVFISWVAVF